MLIVREDVDARRADLARWGLIPAWLTDLSCTPNHAWAETLAEQPMFHEVSQQRRCLLSVDGFYEWREVRKCPHWASTGERLLFFAGTWEAYPVQGQTWLSMAQVSQATAEFRRSLLPDETEQDTWLTPDAPLPALINLLAKPQPNLRSVALAGFVNKPETDGPGCLAPA